MNKNSLIDLDKRHSLNLDNIQNLGTIEEQKFSTSQQQIPTGSQQRLETSKMDLSEIQEENPIQEPVKNLQATDRGTHRQMKDELKVFEDRQKRKEEERQALHKYE